ncbi:MAG: hypothetical protein OEZ36_00115 [Spirochaetota bacterium]|nr:hypothetical protein [Spirochaetota bacterium]
MKKTSILFFVISLVIALSGIEAFNKDRDTDRSFWYYGKQPDEVRIMRNMDDKLLGLKSVSFIKYGRVLDANSQRGVSNALISVWNTKQKKLASVKANKAGLFVLPDMKIYTEALIIKAEAYGYTPTAKSVNFQNASPALDIPLIPSRAISLRRGETKTIRDSQNMVQLTVPADIVKRLDNRAIQYPITISLSYIDPYRNLEAMPGMDMLSKNKWGNITPLMSAGAVIIDAKDRSGAPLRLDKRKVRWNKSTELRVKIPDWMPYGKIPTQLKSWDIDTDRGQVVWNESKNRIISPDDLDRGIAKVFPRGYLLKYARNLATRVNSSKPGQSSGGGNVTLELSNKMQTGDAIRLNTSVREDTILKNLPYYMLKDIKLSGGTVNCLYTNVISEGEGDNAVVHTHYKVYDARYNSVWYKINSYQTKDVQRNWLRYPYFVTKGFDYRPLIKNMKTVCFAYKAQEWAYAATIRSVDLIPFNLDVPKPASPILVRLKERTGDGKFKVFIEVGSGEGRYQLSRILTSSDQPAEFKVLAPASGEAVIKVIPDFLSPSPKEIARYRIPASATKYRWGNKGKREAVDMRGQPPLWRLLGSLDF